MMKNSATSPAVGLPSLITRSTAQLEQAPVSILSDLNQDTLALADGNRGAVRPETVLILVAVSLVMLFAVFWPQLPWLRGGAATGPQQRPLRLAQGPAALLQAPAPPVRQLPDPAAPRATPAVAVISALGSAASVPAARLPAERAVAAVPAPSPDMAAAPPPAPGGASTVPARSERQSRQVATPAGPGRDARLRAASPGDADVEIISALIGGAPRP